jgi:hypothetical protein
VYVNNPHALEELQENTGYETSTIPTQQLQHVSGNIFSQCGEHLEAEGLETFSHNVENT